MKKPDKYTRLFGYDGQLAGTRRIIVEYLPWDGDKWQLEPIDYDSVRSVNLTIPPKGIASLPRQKIGKE